jgi:hypothetical protein
MEAKLYSKHVPITIQIARVKFVRSTCLLQYAARKYFICHWITHLSTKAIGNFRMHSMIKDEWEKRNNCICHLLEHCDILDEKIQLEDKMCPLENHAVSKSHLH